MIYQDDINSLQTNLKNKIGQKIIVKGSLGRSKLFEEKATIEKAYPAFFLVKYDENKRNVSFQYKDVLTRTVEVDVYDGEGYSPLIPPMVKTTRKRRTAAEIEAARQLEAQQQAEIAAQANANIAELD